MDKTSNLLMTTAASSSKWSCPQEVEEVEGAMSAAAAAASGLTRIGVGGPSHLQYVCDVLRDVTGVEVLPTHLQRAKQDDEDSEVVEVVCSVSLPLCCRPDPECLRHPV